MEELEAKHLNVAHVFNDLQYRFNEYLTGILLAHYGGISRSLANCLVQKIESIVADQGEDVSLTKRVFTIVVEGLQNILKYGVQNNLKEKYGHIILGKENGHYALSFGNVCKNEDIGLIIEELETLNNMSIEDRKTYYLERLTNGIKSQNNCWDNLGFITMALKSNTVIGYQFIDVDERHSYFEMHLQVVYPTKD